MLDAGRQMGREAVPGIAAMRGAPSLALMKLP